MIGTLYESETASHNRGGSTPRLGGFLTLVAVILLLTSLRYLILSDVTLCHIVALSWLYSHG